ncbi:MAG: PAS domain S-box protein [Chitinophagaceae bacterium]|nr:MAG: PAS domain S-box protein [Chitinophagaceae bacterium]
MAFLAGGGEMGALTRTHHWEHTPLGSPAHWPQSLRSYVSLLLQSTFPMLLFWGPELTIFYNDAYRKRLGADGKHRAMLGARGEQAWAEVWPSIGPMIDDVLQKGNAILCENIPLSLYRNGELQAGYWTFSYSPVLNEAGARAGVFVVCTETTETVRTMQELEHSNERARLAIESGELGVVEVDLLTEDVHVSERIERIFGLQPGSTRTDFLQRMHPDDLLLREAAYKSAMSDGKLEYESRVFRDDGSMKWIRLKGSVLFNEAKQPVRMISMVQDITDQKLFSQELARQVREQTLELESAHSLLLSSHSSLQSIINVFTSALQVLEPVRAGGDVVDFRYKLTNEAYAAYTGKTPEELKGRLISELFPGYFDTDSFRNIREVAMSGKPKLWQNHYAADGLNIYNEMGAVPMNGDIVVHLTDFTGLKKLQLELERNIAELMRSNQNLEEFAHAASHDLKEPIRKIHFFTQQLKDQLCEQLTEAQQSSFERIERASRRMGLLVDDLLTYSQVTERPHEQVEVDLNELAQRVLEDLELDINETGAEIRLEPLPRVSGYRRQLQQLLQNLVSNAIKYSKPGRTPVITLSAGTAVEQDITYHVLSVTDNGIGFDNTYSEKIFQMFARLHGKAEYSGTGIGLSIVKKVVENHNGFVRARGKEGEGAVFEVYLPA